jgi:hypothetical protein
MSMIKKMVGQSKSGIKRAEDFALQQGLNAVDELELPGLLILTKPRK